MVEPVAFRRQRALDLGATLALDPHTADLRARLLEHTRRPATTVIVATSNLRAIEQTLELAERAATIMLFAPPPQGQPASIDLERLFFSEWTITASYGSGPEDTRSALRLIHAGVVDAARLLTDRFPLERAAEAIARTANPGDSLKCIVEFAVEGS